MENKSMLTSGKLGDFFHSMIIPYHIYESTGVKTKLYVDESGETFRHGLKTAYDELQSIVTSQPYIESFEIYNNEPVDINVTQFRKHSPYLYRKCWIYLYLKTYFNIDPPYKNFSYVKYDKIDETTNGSLIISRTDYRHHSNQLYENVINSFDGNKYFLYTQDNFWNVFPYKDNVIPLKVETIDDMFKHINSCDLFIGNQSAPLAIATVLNKSRMGELGGIDSFHYIGDEEYYDNFSHFSEYGMYICDEHK